MLLLISVSIMWGCLSSLQAASPVIVSSCVSLWASEMPPEWPRPIHWLSPTQAQHSPYPTDIVHLFLDLSLSQNSGSFMSSWPHHATCGILIPWPGIEPMSPDWESRVPTTGPPRKSLGQCFIKSSPQSALEVGKNCRFQRPKLDFVIQDFWRWGHGKHLYNALPWWF